MESIPKEWLQKRVERNQVLSDIMTYMKEESFRSQIQKSVNDLLSDTLPSDEVWSFASGESSFKELAGRAGHAVVRDGEIVKVWTWRFS